MEAGDMAAAAARMRAAALDMARPVAHKYAHLPAVVGRMSPLEVGAVMRHAANPHAFLPLQGMTVAEFCLGYCNNMSGKQHGSAAAAAPAAASAATAASARPAPKAKSTASARTHPTAVPPVRRARRPIVAPAAAPATAPVDADEDVVMMVVPPLVLAEASDGTEDMWLPPLQQCSSAASPLEPTAQSTASSAPPCPVYASQPSSGRRAARSGRRGAAATAAAPSASASDYTPSQAASNDDDTTAATGFS